MESLVGTGPPGGFPSDLDFIVAHQRLQEIELEPWQVERVRLMIPPEASYREVPIIAPLQDAIAATLADVVNSYERYYDYIDVERLRHRGFVRPLVRQAILLARPEVLSHIRASRRRDVYPTIWNLLVVENFKFVMLIGGAMFRVINSYRALDRLRDGLFRESFQNKWRDLMVYRDPYYGFKVQPMVGVHHMARYLVSRGGDTTIRQQVSDHLLHLCQERPFVLEAIAPLFKEKAFRERVKSAYKPLVDKTVRTVMKRSGAGSQEAHGQYAEDIRRVVNEAFDWLLRRFDYYFKSRPGELVVPRWYGMIGQLPEDLRQMIERISSLDSTPPPDWDREIAFSHYIEQKLLRLVRHLADEPGRITDRDEAALPDDDVFRQTESEGEKDDEVSQLMAEDTARRGKGSNCRPREEIPQPETDERGFLRITQMAQIASHHAGFRISEYQLRAWAGEGTIPAERAQSFSDAKLPIRLNYWLFRPDEDTISSIVSRARMTAVVPTNMISRHRLAELLHVSEKTFRRYDRKGWLTPVKIGGAVYYDTAEVQGLQQRTQFRPGRPRRQPL